jgi:CMP-N-acetylneuraminic acid synthetase
MKKMLTVIPIRSNSKGVKNKNIASLAGKPLVYHVIAAAKKSKVCNKIIVSTDSEEYAKIAEKSGAEIPFIRPKSLGKSNVRLHHVLKHAIEFFDNNNQVFDSVLSLQATVPLVKPTTIKKVVNNFESSNCDSIGTISEIRHGHPYISKKLVGKENNIAKDFLPLKLDVPRYPRQKRPSLYYFNGSIFIRKRSLITNIDESTNCMGHKPRTYLMDEKESINIDSKFDFLLAEIIYKQNQSNL